ncbi:MAG: sugar phosphate nucleotidyltransferase [Conexivisphaera sp.]
MIRKAVVTAAGLGTRLSPATKELPKEMLPVFHREGGRMVVKPLLQLIFEQLHSIGIREFCFVIGRGKRAIEDHFTQDPRFLRELRERGKDREAESLERFYSMLSDSVITWVNQPEPRGFGDAVLKARAFVGSDRFMVAAGDTYIISGEDGNSHLRELASAGESADAVLLLRRVPDPSQYGVAVVRGGRVLRVVEKPRERISSLAIMPFYAFSPGIMDHLARIGPGVGGEVQLTDAIQSALDSGSDVRYVLLGRSRWLDIGTPESYWRALYEAWRAWGRGRGPR